MLQYDAVKIQVRVMGEGKPVVILHGFGRDHRMMTGCMEPVFQAHSGYRRIYIDLPGMGGSDGPPARAGADQILELLVSLIDRMVDGCFLLVGESYGGYLARGILSSPLSDRVDGLLLLCPVVRMRERTSANMRLL